MAEADAGNMDACRDGLPMFLPREPIVLDGAGADGFRAHLASLDQGKRGRGAVCEAAATDVMPPPPPPHPTVFVNVPPRGAAKPFFVASRASSASQRSTPHAEAEEAFGMFVGSRSSDAYGEASEFRSTNLSDGSCSSSTDSNDRALDANDSANSSSVSLDSSLHSTPVMPSSVPAGWIPGGVRQQHCSGEFERAGGAYVYGFERESSATGAHGDSDTDSGLLGHARGGRCFAAWAAPQDAGDLSGCGDSTMEDEEEINLGRDERARSLSPDEAATRASLLRHLRFLNSSAAAPPPPAAAAAAAARRAHDDSRKTDDIYRRDVEALLARTSEFLSATSAASGGEDADGAWGSALGGSAGVRGGVNAAGGAQGSDKASGTTGAGTVIEGAWAGGESEDDRGMAHGRAAGGQGQAPRIYLGVNKVMTGIRNQEPASQERAGREGLGHASTGQDARRRQPFREIPNACDVNTGGSGGSDGGPRGGKDQKGRGLGGAGVYEFRCQELQKRLVIAEEEAATYAASLQELHQMLKVTVDQALQARQREESLQAQVERLQMEARRHATHRSSLESIYTQKLDSSRHDRDMLALQLGAAMEEIAMRDAALADSAAYMQVLKRRNADLQLQVRALLAARDQNLAPPPPPAAEEGSSVFGLAHIKAKIEAAVAEANACEESERKVRLKDLRLRWHPDKNPVLEEFATEVTKIINEAIATTS